MYLPLSVILIKAFYSYNLISVYIMAKLNVKKYLTPTNMLIGGGAIAALAVVAFKLKGGSIGGLNAAPDQSTEVYFDVEPVEGHAMFLKGYFKNPQTGERKVVSQG